MKFRWNIEKDKRIEDGIIEGKRDLEKDKKRKNDEKGKN